MLSIGRVIHDALHTGCDTLQGERHGWNRAALPMDAGR